MSARRASRPDLRGPAYLETLRRLEGQAVELSAASERDWRERGDDFRDAGRAGVGRVWRGMLRAVRRLLKRSGAA
jgi:hypothetical protein